MKKVVALFGRPNVGKSTLFNRITRTRDAIVDDMPGVTRDRNYGDAKWGDKEFILVDTGGFLTKDTDSFAGDIKNQLEKAMDDCDIIVLVLDGKFGLSSYDSDLLAMLRGVDKPKFYIVNKIDGPEKDDLIYDFYKLGITPFYPVSGEHGYGISNFMNDLLKEIPDAKKEDDKSVINIALVGKPNAGKSSLINKILGDNRMLVSDVPGTTRDSIDTKFRYNDQDYLLIDTAGIRRKSKVNKKIEKFSIIKALKSLERCDIALILIDSKEGVTEQDVKIAGYAEERGCGAIFILNKWDLIEKEPKIQKKYEEDIRFLAPFLSYAPIMSISAKTGKRVHKVFDLIDKIYKEYSTRISTSDVNLIIENAIERNTPPYHKNRRLKFYYSTQVSASPPTFVSFVNHPDGVHFSYKRFLINQIRRALKLEYTPIVLNLRKRKGKEGFLDKFPKNKPQSKMTKKGKNKRAKKRR